MRIFVYRWFPLASISRSFFLGTGLKCVSPRLSLLICFCRLLDQHGSPSDQVTFEHGPTDSLSSYSRNGNLKMCCASESKRKKAFWFIKKNHLFSSHIRAALSVQSPSLLSSCYLFIIIIRSIETASINVE